MKDILSSIITIFVLFVGFTFLDDYRKDPRPIDPVYESSKYAHETIDKIKEGWNAGDQENVESDTMVVKK